MKKFILSLSILFIGIIAKSDNYLEGHGRHMIVNQQYPNGTTFTVTPNNGIVNIQLEETIINFHQSGYGDPGQRKPCIDIMEGNQVRIILKGNNFLQGGPTCPAIRVRPGAELFIDGYSEGNGNLGKLVARGGIAIVNTYSGGTFPEKKTLPGGAGIGGGWDYLPDDTPPTEWKEGLWNPHADNADLPAEFKYSDGRWTQGYGGCGTIHINGAIVEAYGGGNWAPGIGPAGLFAQGGHIVVQLGSQVYAQGGIEAPGIGCSDYSRVHEIKVADGNTRVVAEGGDGAPGIGGGMGSYQRDCKIDAINLAGGYIVAKAGNPENDGLRTPPAIGAMDLGETPSFNFINGVVDVSDGGINASSETVTYTGGNVVVHNTNTAMNFPDGRVSNKLATVVFTDPDITTSEGLTFKVGDNDYVHPGVTGGEDRRLTDDKKMQLHLTSDQTGKVTVYENGLLRYEETARVNTSKYFLITLSDKICYADFDVIGEITDVSRKISYGNQVYPNHSRIPNGDANITLLVRGAYTDDVPNYWYIWYKDGVKVDEGFNHNTYTVRKQFKDDILNYSVKLEPVDNFTFTLNNNTEKSVTGVNVFLKVGTNPIRYFYDSIGVRNLTIEVKSNEWVNNQTATLYTWNGSGLVKGQTDVKTFEYSSVSGIFKNTFVDKITQLEVRSFPLVSLNFNAPVTDIHTSYTGKVLTTANALTEETDIPITNQPVNPGGTATITTDHNGRLVINDYQGDPINVSQGPFYSVFSGGILNSNDLGTITITHDSLPDDLGNFIPGDTRLVPGVRTFEFTAHPSREVAKYYWTYSDATGEHTIFTDTNTLTLRDYNLISNLSITCELEYKHMMDAIKSIQYAFSGGGGYSELDISNLDHEITLPYYADQISFRVEKLPANEGVTIKGAGNNNLNFGNNEFNILVISKYNISKAAYKITVNRMENPTGIAAVDSKITVRRLSNNILIDTPNKETISIYDLNGILIKKLNKEAGTVQVDLGNYRLRNFLVVRGSDWVRKIW